MHPDVDELKRQMASRVRQLMDEHDLTGLAFERRTRHSRKNITWLRNAGTLPAQSVIVALDETLGAGGELAELGNRIRAAQKAIHVQYLIAAAQGGGTRGGPGTTVDADGEVDEMDPNRRQAFEFAGAGLVAAETYRQWTTTGPDGLTLDELNDAINAHAVAFTVEPHSQLAPKVWRTWQSAHAHLRSGGGRARSQMQLTIVAGYASYMLSRLAFNLGDTVTARRFARLAGDHADQSSDVVLAASVGEMLTTLAFYNKAYGQAVNAARRTTAVADDNYTRARIAAYEARALGGLGDVAGARVALTRMRSSVVDLPLQPGCSPFSHTTADLFEAGVLARIGAGREAEPIARRAVEAFDSGHAVGFEDHGGALLALAWSLTAREHPVVDEAATIAGQVVGMLDSTPTASTAERAREVASTFEEHRAAEPVRDFWARWESRPRLALTTGQA